MKGSRKMGDLWLDFPHEVFVAADPVRHDHVADFDRCVFCVHFLDRHSEGLFAVAKKVIAEFVLDKGQRVSVEVVFGNEIVAANLKPLVRCGEYDLVFGLRRPITGACFRVSRSALAASRAARLISTELRSPRSSYAFIRLSPCVWFVCPY
jgi:hypothetical protein